MAEKKNLEQLQAMALEGTLEGKFDVSNDDYHALNSPGVSKSDLDLIHKMPYLYYVQKITGEHKPEPSEAMVLGSAIHSALIEPEVFKNKYISDKQFIEVDGKKLGRNTKLYKEAVEKFVVENPDKVLMDYGDYDKIEGILKSVNENDLAKILLSEGEAEMSYYWKDEKTNIIKKCRPDYVRISPTGKSYITEIKKRYDASMFTPKSLYDFRYHIQAAHCLEVIQKVTGCDPNQLYFVFLVIEDKYPFGTRQIELKASALIQAIKERDRDIDTLKKCLTTGIFPKYETLGEWGVPQIEYLDLPQWVYYREEFSDAN